MALYTDKAKESMKQAALEVIFFCLKEKADVDAEWTVVDILAGFDGTWQKRGYEGVVHNNVFTGKMGGNA